jgi:60 kDa SS-A/Ro ribonucleoprotein
MRTNVAVATTPIHTHEGDVAQRQSPLQELRRTVMTCMLWEDTFYEKGNDIAARIADLCAKVAPDEVAALAVEARTGMKLRHVPLFLVRELARRKGNGASVEATLAQVIQRADELGEFVSLYWREKKQPLSAGVKRGLAAAFQRFDAYHLAKYNRDTAVKLRDVLFLCHAKPSSATSKIKCRFCTGKYPDGRPVSTCEDCGGSGYETVSQSVVWKMLVDKTLESPDTWEVALSGGADKKETFERLMREKKLGGMATLRNLRNMIQCGADESLVRERLSAGCGMALPFRFVTAARHAPRLEDAIEQAMFKSVEGMERLPGSTGLLVDVSGSMNATLSQKSEATRVDVAAGLAILLREIGEKVAVATFSERVVEVPSRRGFALRDAIHQSQPHSGTYLAKAVTALSREWNGIDRLIVITDEQSADGGGTAFAGRNYIVNVASYQHGVAADGKWRRINGWSDRILDYIREYERAES